MGKDRERKDRKARTLTGPSGGKPGLIVCGENKTVRGGYGRNGTADTDSSPTRLIWVTLGAQPLAPLAPADQGHPHSFQPKSRSGVEPPRRPPVGDPIEWVCAEIG